MICYKKLFDIKKALISRLFPVDLDAPYMNLGGIFILKINKIVEI